MNSLPQNASDANTSSLVSLSLGLREPASPKEVVLANEIKTIIKKGHAIEIPKEFV
jgi:hypothetical protein